MFTVAPTRQDWNEETTKHNGIAVCVPKSRSWSNFDYIPMAHSQNYAGFT
jgi:hypothetical protein